MEEADQYPDVVVNFISGLSPRVTFFKNEKLDQVVELASFNTQEIRDLFLSKGFKPISQD